MGIFDPNQWRAWATQWGLTHHPAKFGKREWLSGNYKGYLVRMGWDDQRGNEFYALVRYQRVATPAMVRQRLAEDPSLTSLPGWKRIKPDTNTRDMIPSVSGQPWRVLNFETPQGTCLKVGESALVWRVLGSWGRPSPKKLQAGWYVFVQLLTHDPRDIALSAILGLVGAFYTFKLLSKPKFVPSIQEETESTAKAAA